jgi:hypothetical protein
VTQSCAGCMPRSQATACGARGPAGGAVGSGSALTGAGVGDAAGGGGADGAGEEAALGGRAHQAAGRVPAGFWALCSAVRCSAVLTPALAGISKCYV